MSTYQTGTAAKVRILEILMLALFKSIVAMWVYWLFASEVK